MKCFYCGKQISPRAKRCKHCGDPLQERLERRRKLNDAAYDPAIWLVPIVGFLMFLAWYFEWGSTVEAAEPPYEEGVQDPAGQDA